MTTTNTNTKTATNEIIARHDQFMSLNYPRYDIAMDSWLTLTSSEGLPADNVQSLAIDTFNSRLWIGTTAGVTWIAL